VELDELNYELFPKVYLPGLESEALKSPELKIKANNRIYPICENVDIYNRLKKLNPALIQLRIKEVPFSSLGRTLNEIDQGDSLACKILNDFDGHINPEIFGGIHLGQEDIYRADLSAIKEKKLVLGVSTHCYFELAIAAGLSPSYVALGPIFDTPCKSMSFGPRGYEKIREWKKILRTIPVVAIGGMTPKRAKEAFQYGADVVAVQSDITLAENPEERFLHYVEYLAK
jgi:thiamine-phosphate pyrophosphorylase